MYLDRHDVVWRKLEDGQYKCKGDGIPQSLENLERTRGPLVPIVKKSMLLSLEKDIRTKIAGKIWEEQLEIANWFAGNRDKFADLQREFYNGKMIAMQRCIDIAEGHAEPVRFD